MLVLSSFFIDCLRRDSTYDLGWLLIFFEKSLFPFYTKSKPILMHGFLWNPRISFKTIELFSNFSWTSFESSSSLNRTNSASNCSQICCFSLRAFSKRSFLLFSFFIWFLNSLMIFSIYFSSFSCLPFYSTTKLFSCLYLFLYLFNSFKALRSPASILTSPSTFDSSSFSISSLSLISSIPRKRTSSSSLSLESFELLSSYFE